MANQIKQAVGFLIQNMCKTCAVKDCKDCLYLNEALSGGTRSIKSYIKTQKKVYGGYLVGKENQQKPRP